MAQAFRRLVIDNPILAEIMFSRPFADFESTAEDNEAGMRVSSIFVTRARAAAGRGPSVSTR